MRGVGMLKVTAKGAPRPLAHVRDEELVARTLTGRREAFETLVRRHQGPLVNHIYRLTGQRDDVFDLAQEVFLKVYTSLASFDPRYRFTTWLYRIASNCVIDHRRKKKLPTCTPPSRPDRASETTPEPEVAGREPDPHDVFRLRELQRRLDRAIETLPSNYRHLILLRHRHALRYDEIARATGLPLGTVKNRIFRAREILKHELAEVLDRES